MKRRRIYRRLRRIRRNPFGRMTNMALGGAEASMAIGLGSKMASSF